MVASRALLRCGVFGWHRGAAKAVVWQDIGRTLQHRLQARLERKVGARLCLQLGDNEAPCVASPNRFERVVFAHSSHL